MLIVILTFKVKMMQHKIENEKKCHLRYFYLEAKIQLNDYTTSTKLITARLDPSFLRIVQRIDKH